MGRIDIVSTKSIRDRIEIFLPYYLGATPEEAEETYRAFSSTIDAMSDSYSRNTDVAKEDYFGDAIAGLARAKRDWDPTRGGCKFRTFAIMKIKNALNECCRKNSSIVNIPYYVRTAHTYITNVKTILEAYDIEPKGIKYTLENCRFPKIQIISKADHERVVEELRKLENLARNSGVILKKLVRRAEFVPSDMSYDESMTQDEMFKREQRRLSAALMVSKLEDYMTKEELHVAQGIMSGRSYAEIGRIHDPKRSVAWVRKKLDEMSDKFKIKMKEGL